MIGLGKTESIQSFFKGTYTLSLAENLINTTVQTLLKLIFQHHIFSWDSDANNIILYKIMRQLAASFNLRKANITSLYPYVNQFEISYINWSQLIHQWSTSIVFLISLFSSTYIQSSWPYSAEHIMFMYKAKHQNWLIRIKPKSWKALSLKLPWQNNYIVVKTKLPNRLPNSHTCWSLNLPIGSRFSEPYFFLGTILNPTDTTTTRHDWWMLVILGYVKVPQMAKMVQLGMKKFNVLFNLHMQN